ncbi:MAG: c-type cytochrome [Nitrospira sp.]
MRKLLISCVGVVALLVLSAVLWVGYDVYTTGFSAKTEPPPLEVALVRQFRRASIPSEIRNRPNPVLMSPEVLTEGLDHFADHCAGCHANDGSGKTLIGTNVYPRVPDLRLKDIQSMSDGELFFAIHNGIRFTAMPAWGDGDIDKDKGSWKLVHFIRHLPQLTHEELNRLKALSSKAPRGTEPGSHHH